MGLVFICKGYLLFQVVTEGAQHSERLDISKIQK
jgi:hypothetical protein